LGRNEFYLYLTPYTSTNSRYGSEWQACKPTNMEKNLENTSYKVFLSRFFLDRLPNK
jgi:hypothetical protein